MLYFSIFADAQKDFSGPGTVVCQPGSKCSDYNEDQCDEASNDDCNVVTTIENDGTVSTLLQCECNKAQDCPDDCILTNSTAMYPEESAATNNGASRAAALAASGFVAAATALLV